MSATHRASLICMLQGECICMADMLRELLLDLLVHKCNLQ